ncbi:hypothetical protein [Celerinatantimonas sp. MCCC 1A17872]|uniref:rolling circle replication-associated protein n=1 Tax=Celerinatantimonas sp. MCCC 1A17872 TaxID=3177514 RepID=UPI0038CB683B
MIDPQILNAVVAGLEPAFFGGEYHPEVLPEFSEPKGPLFDRKSADKTLLHHIQRTSRAALPKAETARLVQRCKSPTPRQILADSLNDERSRAKQAQFEAEQHRAHEINRLFEHYNHAPKINVKREVTERDYSIKPNVITKFDRETGEVLATQGPKARIYQREWSNEYRVRIEAQVSLSTPPEANTGERSTDALNGRAASKIMDSGAYVQAVRGGFTTFLTLTFNPEARSRIVSGESTIGAEVSRFFDAAKKRYHRGFAMDHEVLKTVNGFHCLGASCTPEETAHDDEFDYIWCAEMPKNENGEANPHCHVLMRWDVPPYLFHDWAYRIEKLWGQGFAKLERIRDAHAAGGYLLKALGYVTKGSKKDQGTIHGNRYNISRSARAPKWECIASFYADNMTAIINELRDRWRWEDAPIKARIENAKAQLAQKKKAYMIAKKQKRFPTADKLKARLEQLTSEIKSHWQHLKSREARADEYQLTMKGDKKLTRFLSWAIARRGWRFEEPENAYLGTIDQQQKIEWIKQARRTWRKAAEWAGFNWFHTTHEAITLDAGTMADVLAWENFAYQP